MALEITLKCKRHPKYAAVRKPLDRLKNSVGCGCWRLWRLAEEIRKGGKKGTILFLEELNY